MNPPDGGGSAGPSAAILEGVAIDRGQRTYWWDAGRPAGASLEPLGAVVFDLDGMAGGDGAGLDDLVNSLYFGGIPVAVIGSNERARVADLARQLIGDGIAETVVTPDDLPQRSGTPDLHGHALWELGLGPEAVLAITGTAAGLRAARAAKLATVVVGESGDAKGAAQVRDTFVGLLAADCEAVHRRWWAAR